MSFVAAMRKVQPRERLALLDAPPSPESALEYCRTLAALIALLQKHASLRASLSSSSSQALHRCTLAEGELETNSPWALLAARALVAADDVFVRWRRASLLPTALQQDALGVIGVLHFLLTQPDAATEEQLRLQLPLTMARAQRLYLRTRALALWLHLPRRPEDQHDYDTEAVVGDLLARDLPTKGQWLFQQQVRRFYVARNEGRYAEALEASNHVARQWRQRPPEVAEFLELRSSYPAQIGSEPRAHLNTTPMAQQPALLARGTDPLRDNEFRVA